MLSFSERREQHMETMNIALPESMKEFVQREVERGGYSSVSEYIRALIRADQKRKIQEELEAAILKGLESGEPTPITQEDWQAIRHEVRRRHAERQRQT
jgi:antitoxin ParD1/3/4